MKKINLEELKQEFKNLQKQNQIIEKNIDFNLREELIDFFLEKADIFKLLERVTKYYNIKNGLIIKQFLHIKPDIELTELILKNSFKENNIPNKVLTFKEKKALEEVFLANCLNISENELATRNNIRDKKLKKEEERKNNKRREFLEYLNNANDLLSSMENFESFHIHEKNKIKKSIKRKFNQSEHYKKDIYVLSIKEQENFNLIYNRFKKFLKKSRDSEKKEKQQFNKVKEELIKKETLKTLEYQQKIKEFKEKQEQELLQRIEDRKKGLLVEDNKVTSKIEPIVIEAYLEDFNSERSRFVLSVLTANNIYLSFYNGVIKLLHEDDSFDEVYFSTKGSTLKFTNVKYIKEILIDTVSTKKISDILLNQTNSKIYSDLILNCLSILHYINTFYNEHEKIEVAFEDIDTIKINKLDEKDMVNTKSLIYLTKSRNKQTIRTIKIRKGKRNISGTFLTRGHWRRQKYLTGIKLIWIEPFWKGFGKKKERIYIINNK